MGISQSNLKEIFHAAIEKKTAAERSAYLDGACKDNEKLRAELEALLKAHFEAGESFLKSPPGEDVTLDIEPLSESPGTKIGHYKLLQLIGEGGFGVVYMAEQEEPIRRRVAFKIIKLGMDTKHVIARFEAERQALALMEHPNIAQVFDAGATETGRPYFVMELVKGIPVTEYCDKNNLDTNQRLKLFIDVCKAVQHAHQKGIIHRDIKPSNVMITLHDGKPVPKVIDFGIAKATQHRLTEKTLFTEFRQFIGTPEYMSPEQAEMSGLDVDTRSDIYSLGVLLYELLTGTTPFETQQLRGAAYDEMRRIIREDEPLRPSMRLSTLGDALTDIAKNRQVLPGELCRIIHGDLDWIVMKTLEKDRTRRYESANVLAMDIERHLADEPVIASPPSQVYRLHKLIRRHRTAVGAALLIAAAIVIGLVASTTMYFQAEQARQEEAAAHEQAHKAQGIAETARQKETDARIEAQEAEKVAEQQYKQAQHLLAKAQFERGIRLLNEGDETGMLGLLEAWETAEESPALKASIGRLWAIAHDLSAGRLISILPGSPIQSISPDGKYLVTFVGQTAQLWEMGTWQPHGPPLQLEKDISAVKFSPDGRLLAAHSLEGVSRLWDTATGQPFGPVLLHELEIQTAVTNRWPLDKYLHFSPNGKFLAAGYFDDTVCLWDTVTGQPYGKILKHGRLQAMDFSPDGKLIAIGGIDMNEQHWSAQLWDVETGEPYGASMVPEDAVENVLFSPDGKLLVTKEGATRLIHVWDTETGQLYRKLQHDRWTGDIEFSPDGALLAAGSWDRTAPIWEIATGKLIGKTAPHGGGVNNVAFSPDGKLLATNSGADKTMRLWDVAASQPYGPQLHCPDGSGALLFSPDNEFLVSPGNRIWKTRRLLNTEMAPYQASLKSTAFSPDGKTSAVIIGNTVQLWNTATKQLLAEPLEHDHEVTNVAFSPDGKILACSYGGFYPTLPGTRSGQYNIGYIRLWEVYTGQPMGPILETGFTFSLTFNSDGKLLANGTIGATAEVFDMTTFERSGMFRCSGYVYAVAFSADSKILAAGLTDGMVELWDMTSAEQIDSPLILPHEVVSVAFSPDSNLLATVSGNEEQTVRIWDIGSEPPYQNVMLPPLAMRGADVLESFSNDGTVLVSPSGEGAAQAWRLPQMPTDLRQMQLRTWIALGAQPSQSGGVVSIGLDRWYRLRQELAQKAPATEPKLVYKDSGGLQGVKLLWTPGSDAVTHHVYLGTAPDQLHLQDKVQEAACENIPDLDKDKTYWWRIDTVRSDGSVIIGDLWRSHTGLISFWKLDEAKGQRIADASGNGLEGELIGDARIITDDERGNVLSLDGDGDYVDCGNDSLFDITEEVTVAAWIKPKDCGNDQYNVYAGKGDLAYHLQHERGNVLEFCIHDGTWYSATCAVDSSFNDAWHHIVGTYDGNVVRLYVDGVLQAVTEHHGAIDSETANVNLGRSSDFNDRLYEGLMDDVRIYNYALSSDDAAALYAGQELKLPDRPQWFFEVSSQDYMQSDVPVDSNDVYEVRLKSEHDPKEQLIYQLRDLNTVCDAFIDLKRLDSYKIDIRFFCYKCGLANLITGDTDEYRERCSALLEYFEQTDDPNGYDSLVWTSILAPNAVEDLEKIVELAELAVERGGETDQNRSALGMIFYRAGRLDEAVEQLTELSNTWDIAGQYPIETSPAYTWFFLAMAHHQLGNLEEAGSWFDKAAERAEEELQDTPAWNRQATLQLLQGQAEQLLGMSQGTVQN